MPNSINLTIPGSATNLVGTVTLTATPSTGVLAVSFYIDDILATTDTSAPYTYDWDTTLVTAGAHQLKVVGTWPKNQVAEKKLDVTVANQQPLPAPLALIQAVPVNSTAPAISGTATEGQTLTITPGVWTNDPSSYSRQWMRCGSGGGGCTPISSATGDTYTLIDTDVGGTIRCWVTAYNSTGASKVILTTQTSVVSALAPAVPSNLIVPVITGIPTQGQILTVSNGDWTGSPTSYTREWLRCDTTGENCASISGAVNSTYQLVAADVGKSIRCNTIATNSSGNSTAVRSAATQLIAALPTTPPPPATATITSNVTNGQEITAPYTWTATVSPTPTSVEFWADGNLLATDTTSPYSTTLNLPPGQHQLDVCARYSTGQQCAGGASGVLATVTILGTPAPPPVVSNNLPTYRATLPAGAVAVWAVHDSATTQKLSNTGGRDKHRIIRWSAGNLYSGRVTYAVFGYRLISGAPGRMFDFHTQPDDAGGWTPPCNPSGVAPVAIDYWNDSRGLYIVSEPEDAGCSGGSGNYRFMVLSQAETEARRNQWVWIWAQITWGRRDIATKGALKVWLAGEDNPRVNVSTINTHFTNETMVSFWEGEYYSNKAPNTSVVEIAATRFGRTPKEAYEDVPVLYSIEPAGTPGGSGVSITPTSSTLAAIPLSLRW